MEIDHSLTRQEYEKSLKITTFEMDALVKVYCGYNHSVLTNQEFVTMISMPNADGEEIITNYIECDSEYNSNYINMTNYNGEISIEACMPDTSSILKFIKTEQVLPIVLRYNKSNSMHVIMLIFEESGDVFLFDPNGSEVVYPGQCHIDKILQKYIDILKESIPCLKYHSNYDKNHSSLQKKSWNTLEFDTGKCVLWIPYMINLLDMFDHNYTLVYSYIVENDQFNNEALYAISKLYNQLSFS